jgi:hypothetical protein
MPLRRKSVLSGGTRRVHQAPGTPRARLVDRGPPDPDAGARLTPVADYANNHGAPAALIACRERVNRYTCCCCCPSCHAEHNDVVTPHPQNTLHFPGVPLRVLGPPMPGSAEWFLLNR